MKVKHQRFAGLIIWKCLIDFMYADIITDVYAYMNNIADYNYLKLAISWLLFGVLVFSSTLIRNNVLQFSFDFLMIISAIPSLTVWWVRNDNSKCLALIMFYWFAWCLFSIIFSAISITGKNHIQKTDISSRAIFLDETNFHNYQLFGSYKISIIIFMLIVCIVIVLFCSNKYGGMRIFVKLEDVYKYRNSGIEMPSILGYCFNWISTIILPLMLLVCLINKRWIPSLICCMLISMCYSIYGNKTFLFMIILPFIIAILNRNNIRKYFLVDIIWMLNLAVAVSCILQKLNITRWGVALIDRITTGVSAGHFYYYDYFQTHKFLYLSQSILRFWIKSPYIQPIGVIIGSNAKYNLTGDYNNFNNGVFSDAYANFGFLGLIIFPFLFVLSLKIFDEILYNTEIVYKYLVLCFLLFYCISIGYFQWLNSGGYIVAILVIRGYQLIKSKRLC